MQVTKDKLAAQQLVLFHLGYYKGTIDGIWSAASIAAKRKFEGEPGFLPAYPNNGLPFGERDKLPKGWRYGVKGIIGHSTLTPERTKEILDAHAARIAAAAKPVAEQGPTAEGEGLKGPDAVAEGEVNGLAGPSAEEAQAQRQHNGQQHRHDKHQKGNR
ncbi:hypothetical protein D3C85_478950 [compost metagenome]